MNPQPAQPEPRRKRSMHDDVETWDDCCVCEPEPRWQQLAEEWEQHAPREARPGPHSDPTAAAGPLPAPPEH